MCLWCYVILFSSLIALVASNVYTYRYAHTEGYWKGVTNGMYAVRAGRGERDYGH